MQRDDGQSFDFKHYLAIVERRKYVALAVGLAVLSLFTWSSFLLPKAYEASATVSIERDSILKPLMEGVGVSSTIEARLVNLKNEIVSSVIIEKAMKKLGLASKMNSGQANSLIEDIKRNLIVTVKGQSRETNLFNILTPERSLEEWLTWLILLSVYILRKMLYPEKRTRLRRKTLSRSSSWNTRINSRNQMKK